MKIRPVYVALIVAAALTGHGTALAQDDGGDDTPPGWDFVARNAEETRVLSCYNSNGTTVKGYWAMTHVYYKSGDQVVTTGRYRTRGGTPAPKPGIQIFLAVNDGSKWDIAAVVLGGLNGPNVWARAYRPGSHGSSRSTTLMHAVGKGSLMLGSGTWMNPGDGCSAQVPVPIPEGY